jgi:putative hydrolase
VRHRQAGLATDQHSAGECRLALDAGVPADRIVNTWPVDKLLAWTHQN